MEFVILQVFHHSGEIRRKKVKLHVLVRRTRLSRFLAPGIARLPSLFEHLLQRVALLIDDVAQTLGNLVVDATEVVVFEGFFTPLTKLLQHLAQARDLLTVAVLETLLKHLAERCIEVAVVQEVIVHLRHDVVGVKIEPYLGSIPARVLQFLWHDDLPALATYAYYRPR